MQLKNVKVQNVLAKYKPNKNLLFIKVFNDLKSVNFLKYFQHLNFNFNILIYVSFGIINQYSFQERQK